MCVCVCVCVSLHYLLSTGIYETKTKVCVFVSLQTHTTQHNTTHTHTHPCLPRGMLQRLEKIQCDFGRRLLGLSTRATDEFVRSELAMQSLEERMLKLSLRYYHKLCNSPPDSLI